MHEQYDLVGQAPVGSPLGTVRSPAWVEFVALASL